MNKLIDIAENYLQNGTITVEEARKYIVLTIMNEEFTDTDVTELLVAIQEQK